MMIPWRKCKVLSATYLDCSDDVIVIDLRWRQEFMTVTNTPSGTNLHEIADGIYRINTPVPGFSFNQYLIRDEAPLLFHTGPRKMFPLVREAVAKVLPVESLRYIAFSHVEADE